MDSTHTWKQYPLGTLTLEHAPIHETIQTHMEILPIHIHVHQTHSSGDNTHTWEQYSHT